MRPRLTNVGDIAASVILLAIGVFVAWRAFDYALGTFQRPGAGAMPFGLGILMAGFGIALFVEAVFSDPPETEVAIRPFVFVILGVVAWTVLAPRFGLVPATMALVIICAYGQRPVRLVSAVIVGAVLSIAGVLIFLVGLSVPLRAFDL